MLRWFSDITADGSAVRSIAGRSARLGDGTSRNPVDREALLEQRSKDLRGIIGQVRGFSLEEFLSDYEDPGEPKPWAIGDSVLPETTSPQSTSLPPQGQGPKTAMGDLTEKLRRTGVISICQAAYAGQGSAFSIDSLDSQTHPRSPTGPGIGRGQGDAPVLNTWARMMHAAGVAMTIKALYVPDYIAPQVRIQDQT